MTINLRKLKQKLRPVKMVKKALSKKKNQRRLMLGSGVVIILVLGGFLTQALLKQNEMQARILENQAIIAKTQNDVEGLRRDVEQKQKEIEKSNRTLQDKNKKQAKLEEKIDRLNKQVAILKSYGSGAGGGYHVTDNQAVNVVAGNAYGYGYCTWYVKNKRPEIGSYWGDAKHWYASAQAAGYKTGIAPKAGAIGVSFEGVLGHVVYVESVNGATIHLSEMNGAAGWNVVGERDAPASSFVYIYDKA